jgi:hypothetical protein
MPYTSITAPPASNSGASTAPAIQIACPCLPSKFAFSSAGATVGSVGSSIIWVFSAVIRSSASFTRATPTGIITTAPMPSASAMEPPMMRPLPLLCGSSTTTFGSAVSSGPGRGSLPGSPSGPGPGGGVFWASSSAFFNMASISAACCCTAGLIATRSPCTLLKSA